MQIFAKYAIACSHITGIPNCSSCCDCSDGYFPIFPANDMPEVTCCALT